jgi:hypothetical protein
MPEHLRTRADLLPQSRPASTSFCANGAGLVYMASWSPGIAHVAEPLQAIGEARVP